MIFNPISYIAMADYAVIAVSYPTGSTCKCVNGATTLNAQGTGGKYIFQIPSAGTWTVSCTNGSQTKSQAVSITSQYQYEFVPLSYYVPVGYQQVEWIQMTGTQFINYSFVPSKNSAYYFEGNILFSSSPATKLNTIFATKTTGENDGFSFFAYPSSNKTWYLAFGKEDYMSNASFYDAFHVFKATLKTGQKMLLADSTTIMNKSTSEGPSRTVRYLFRGDGSATNYDASRFTGKVAYLKATKDGANMFALYPCYRISDHVAGFYDNVGGGFYMNAGTGAFTLGNPV